MRPQIINLFFTGEHGQSPAPNYTHTIAEIKINRNSAVSCGYFWSARLLAALPAGH
jgi:hypothetical protein